MIRYLQDREKLDCRSLWEEAFPEDSQSFCDYYFEEKIKDNRILVREEAGFIQAMLHLNPYRLAVNGYRWRVEYIVGVATRADCRRRGYMRELLTDMFAELYEDEMPFVFLMPAAKEIYLPYDFVYIFDQPVWKLKEPDQLVYQTIFPMEEPGIREPEQPFSKPDPLWRDGFGWHKRLDNVAGWINRWLQQNYQVYAVRDGAYLERLGRELESENGKMELIYDGGRMIGVRGEWGSKSSEQRFLYCEIGYREQAAVKPAIMARIVKLTNFIKAIRLNKSCRQEEVQILLQVHDHWIAANNGLWKWYLTKEMSWAEPMETSALTAAEGNSGNESVLELSIGQLTSWLFGYEVPAVCRPYQEIVRTFKNVFLDEIV